MNRREGPRRRLHRAASATDALSRSRGPEPGGRRPGRPPPWRWVLWALLAAPGVVTLGRQASGAIGYGEAIHQSGEWAARLLMLVLSVTPLRLGFPRAAWASWLLQRRRDLGVAVFGYALLHLTVYVAHKAEAPVLILREALDIGMMAGWLAFVGFAGLAATSNDAAVRWLGRRWKALHRLVYAAAALMLAHWIMTAFDPRVGWIYGALLFGVEAARLALARRRRRQSPLQGKVT